MIDVRLICLRHIHYRAMKTPRIHRHSFFQVCYVLQGCGRVYFDNTLQRISAGDVHVYHPRHCHDIWPEPGMALETLDLRFIANDDATLAALANLPAFVRTETQQVLELLQQIEREGSSRNNPLWEEAAHAYLMQLLVTLMRWQNSQDAYPAALVKQALDIMHRSLPKGISIDELSRKLHVNPTYFGGIFRAHVGMAPKAYLTERKLEQIKHILLTSERVNITMLARTYGWNDVRHFRDVFRRYTGKTPTAFARNRQLYDSKGTLESFVLFNADIPMQWDHPPDTSLGAEATGR